MRSRRTAKRVKNRRPRVYTRPNSFAATNTADDNAADGWDLSSPATASDISTAAYAPPAQPTQVHPVQQPVDSDATVKLIAAILIAHMSLEATEAALGTLLVPYKIGKAAIQAALGMASNGTKPRPNARHVEGSVLDATLSGGKDAEVFYRAAYLANCAKRLQISLDGGKDIRQAIQIEWPNFEAHERARKNRQETMSRAQVMAKIVGVKDEHGILLGWYRNPLSNSEAECRIADGNNFYYEDGTVIGYPGSVHPHCRCQAGPPHLDGEMVNDVLNKVVPIDRRRPKFKRKGA